MPASSFLFPALMIRAVREGEEKRGKNCLVSTLPALRPQSSSSLSLFFCERQRPSHLSRLRPCSSIGSASFSLLTISPFPTGRAQTSPPQTSPLPLYWPSHLSMTSSSPNGGSSPDPSSPPLVGNPLEAGWIVQKYGGTSVGKFLDTITGTIIP